MKLFLSFLLIVISLQTNLVKAEEKKKKVSRMQKILNAERQRRIDELNGVDRSSDSSSSSSKFTLDDDNESDDKKEKDEDKKSQ